MKNRWVYRFFSGAAILLAVLAVLSLLSQFVYESDLPESMEFLTEWLDIEKIIKIFYLVAPFLLLIVWAGLYLFHRKQKKIMSLLALILGVASTVLCVIGLELDISNKDLYVDPENLFAIGIKLPVFICLLFGILGYRAEGMPKTFGYLTVLLSLAFAFSNIAQEFRHFAFFEFCFFILLAVWGVWLGILLWRGKLDLEVDAFREGIRKPGQFVPAALLGVGVVAAVMLLAANWLNEAQQSNLRQQRLTVTAVRRTEVSVRMTEVAPTLRPTVTPFLPIRVSVFGIGDLKNEVVQITNATGHWVALGRIEDNQGNKFNFVQSNFTTTRLENGASVQVFSREGVNTITELYWGLKEAIWKSGKTISIYDTQGAQVALYKIP